MASSEVRTGNGLYQPFGRAGAFALVLLGAAVLLGWAFHIELIKTVLPGYASMKVNSAISFVCAGASLLLIFRSVQTNTTRRAAALLGAVVFVIGLLTLAEYFFSVDLKIDQLFFRDIAAGPFPGRPALINGLNSCCIGVALVLLARSKEAAYAPQLLALVPGITAMMAVLGYVYGVPVLYGSIQFFGVSNLSIALHTGVGFLILSASLLLVRPERGLMAVVTSRDPGGWMIRRLFPAASAAAVVLGMVLLRAGSLLGTLPVTVVVIVTFQIVLFAALIWSLAYFLDRAERLRYRAETDREQTQEALAKSEELLRHSQKMEAIGQLAAGIAHDFNNLVSVIVGYSEILLHNSSLSAEERDKLKRIKQAGVSVASWTSQLLAFGRRQVLQPVILDLNEVIRHMEGVLTHLIKEDVQLDLYLASDLSPVRADWGQMEQILVNLAVNAADAMPNGGKLLIQTSCCKVDESSAMRLNVPPGDYARFSVTDTGTGISPEVKAHIFEPFFTTKPAGKGTGLGLATVSGVVQRSSGFLDVESRPGHGSTFNIYLPAAGSKDMVLHAGHETKSPQHGSETVLIVEDEAVLRDLVSESLEHYGYKVMAAASGPDALNLCQEYSGSIDMVITDVIMPDMNGRELMEQLKVLRPSTKVIFMSGYTNDVILRHGVLNNDVAFIQKPFTPSELVRKLRQVLDDNNILRSA